VAFGLDEGAAGHRALPMVVGLDGPRARWTRVLPARDDPHATEGSPTVADVGGGRVYVLYDAWMKRIRLTALDARTGATLWDRPYPGEAPFAYADGRLLLRSRSALHALDAATGADLL
jgi:outer membrane protein assembly factor BamB